MTDGSIRVRIAALRRAGGDLSATAHRLGQGLGTTPGLVVTAPGWATAAALAQVEAAVHRSTTVLGGRAADTADALRRSADGYEAADDRAARRMAGIG
ncbi:MULTISPECIES: type VII secretion target [Polymorphospora]|uniref:Type VII secretion target n=1 Tax=Polymorphospora lycopeni TaxID=3140240 RepID=A0ABV5CYS5_9ACTN